MATDEEKLLIRLEVTQRRFERQLAAANRTADQRARGIEGAFRKSNRNIQRSFKRLEQSAGNTFSGIARLAAAALAGLSVRELSRFADSWTALENQIKSAEQISGTMARTTSELNDIASQTRSGLSETANLYARLLRVSGQLGVSEEEVARATETVAKAFKAGGAAASEQAAGILQLSQALGSGFLQGDELRSLRENAPVIAQAIADEFNTTIGGLKELGAAGELAAGRVFKAILRAEEGIEKAFQSTTATVADGFTVFRNGLTEFVASFDDATRASEGLANFLSEFGTDLAGASVEAARFGGQVREAFAIINEAITTTKDALSFTTEFTQAGAEAEAFGDVVVGVFDQIVARIKGTGALISEFIGNRITPLINAYNAIPGLGDIELPGAAGQDGSALDAYQEAVDSYTRAAEQVRSGSAGSGLAGRIREAGETAARRARQSNAPMQGPPAPPLPPMQGPPIPPEGVNPPEEIAKSYDKVARSAGAAKAAVNEINITIDQQDDLVDRLESSFGSAFTAFVTGAQSAESAAQSLLQSLANIAANRAFETLFGAATGALAGAFLPSVGGVSIPRATSSAFASFDGGGYTGSWSRSGGMDGKGGKLAILHPDEKVTDLTKGGGVGGEVLVRVMVNEAPSFASTVRTEATGTAVRVVQEYDKRQAPAMVQRSLNDPRRRG